jgi:hypothetical protein
MSDDGVPTREQIAEVIAKAEDADYWIDEVREWETQEDWEQAAHPEEYPSMAYEDRESFLRAADAVLALLILRDACGVPTPGVLCRYTASQGSTP